MSECEREGDPRVALAPSRAERAKLKLESRGNGHEKIDEIGNHQKGHTARERENINRLASSTGCESSEERDEIKVNFKEMWFLIFGL